MNTRLAILGSVFAIASAAVAQEAVQWKVSDGGNGHWYQRQPQATTWSLARDLCIARGAHLATITTGGEQVVVAGVNSGMHCWLGGFQQPGSPEPGGGWYWITGEPWEYTNWLSGEPNGSLENALQFHSSTTGWNDLPEHVPEQCICEWSADCNSDGIVDYGQILAGQLADTDENGVPDVCEVDPCPGDVNSSGVVNAVDISVILSAWGTNGGKFPRADTDGSGVVDAADLSVVLGGWGKCP